MECEVNGVLQERPEDEHEGVGYTNEPGERVGEDLPPSSGRGSHCGREMRCRVVGSPNEGVPMWQQRRMPGQVSEQVPAEGQGGGSSRRARRELYGCTGMAAGATAACLPKTLLEPI